MPLTLESAVARSAWCVAMCSASSVSTPAICAFKKSIELLRLRLCAGVSAMQSLPLGNEDIDQLAATLHQRGQTLALGVSHRLDEALAARLLVEHSCECRQCSSIDAVCLGKYPP